MTCRNSPSRMQVHAGVADMADDPAAAAHEHAGGRWCPCLACRPRRWCARRSPGWPRAGRAPCPLSGAGPARSRNGRQLARDDLHRHLAGDFARRVTAHTVGDDKQAPLGISVGVKAVFVACADAPDVGAGGDGKLHVDGVAMTRRNEDVGVEATRAPRLFASASRRVRCDGRFMRIPRRPLRPRPPAGETGARRVRRPQREARCVPRSTTSP